MNAWLQRAAALALPAVLLFGLTAQHTHAGLVGDDGCFPEEPGCGEPFFGIAQLNDVLSNWNQSVPPANPNADWSGDGYIGIDDLNFVLSRWNAGTPPGGDLPCTWLGCGFIGINELNIVLGAWNQNVPPNDPLADRSGDGYVGIDDLNWVLARWNAGTPPIANAIPEPATVGVVSLLGVMCLHRRR